MSRAFDRHPYDAGAFEDDYRGFDMRDDEGGRGPLILALALGVLLIFCAVIWNTYKAGIKPDTAALPVVFAEAEPYKRAPDNPGGAEADDLEHRIYDQLDGSARAVPAGDAPARRVLVGGPPVELRPGQLRGPTTYIPGETDSAADSANVATAALPDIVEPPAPAVQLPASPVVTAAAAPSQAFAADGQFLVQVAALRTEAAANTAWGQFVESDGDLFTGAEKMIQHADLGAKGVFYRLRVGAFAERADASAFCDQLKTRGKSCIVVAR